MPDADDRSAPAPAEAPRFLDTYALVFAFGMSFLIPGLALLARLPFRTYTFAYVSLVAVPFLLAVATTFLTDNHDAPRLAWTRVAILTPLTLFTGVAVLFVGALTVIPISPYLRPENYAVTTPVTVGLLVLLAAPLVLALFKRLRTRPDWRSVLQILALITALAAAVAVGYLMFEPAGSLRGFARKDVTIYATGALMWYLPSFGIAAGVWRLVPLVDAPAAEAPGPSAPIPSSSDAGLPAAS